MKKMLAACVLTLTAVVGFAQTTTDREGVTTSTDPAKAAAVERRVAELNAHDQKVAGSGAGLNTHHVKAHHGRHHRHHNAAAAK